MSERLVWAVPIVSSGVSAASPRGTAHAVRIHPIASEIPFARTGGLAFVLFTHFYPGRTVAPLPGLRLTAPASCEYICARSSLCPLVTRPRAYDCFEEAP
jgi:hypothetical protein